MEMTNEEIVRDYNAAPASSREVKPCPFCGGEAIVELIEIGSGPNRMFSQTHKVKCKKCGANTGKQYRTRFYRENGEFIVLEDGYAQAVSDWNRRTEGGVQP